MINALFRARTVRIVLLLPYEAITADRASALIGICETVGSIFTDYKEASNNITILFNKVPEEKFG
jgi:hypothetical protein